ncbi:MAG: hypothetical protein ABSB59_11020 [Streptosporangiaceae bacterium]|jgi:hypothetical protein
MDDQRDAGWADAMLRRPAVDPGIPAPERALLTAPGALLTPACRPRPARYRDYLPADPGLRGTTIDGTVIGMTAAAFTAVGGATPLAIGTLVFQDPAGWQSAWSRYGLLLAGLLAVLTAAFLVTRIVRSGQPRGRAAAEVAARTYHGRYLTGADFDARSRRLLRRVQNAVDTVTSAEVYRADVVDRAATGLALAGQEWDIAVALHEQARLRATRAGLAAADPDARAATALGRQTRVAHLAEASVADRITALERYAAEVGAADAAYRGWTRAAALAESGRRHLDMLARTAADDHGIAEIEDMSRQARAVRRAFGGPPPG